MRAARIHRFGSPDVIEIEDVPCPVPDPDQVLVRVAAAGVGPWDAWIREKKSVVNVGLPLTLGSDIAGIVESVGSNVHQFNPGDEVYGATNPEFIGAYAEYALVSAGMIAKKPARLSFEEAASAPVVAVTALQMLFDYAKAQAGQSVLIHGAAGSVGAYAVQLARKAGLRIFATASEKDISFVRGLGGGSSGIEAIVDFRTTQFDTVVPRVVIVLDLVGGDTRTRSFEVIKPGGILVSAVSNEPAPPRSIRGVFILVDVTTERLEKLGELFERNELQPDVGTVLPLDQAVTAHEMLAGAPHKRVKIVLRMARPD